MNRSAPGLFLLERHQPMSKSYKKTHVQTGIFFEVLKKFLENFARTLKNSDTYVESENFLLLVPVSHSSFASQEHAGHMYFPHLLPELFLLKT